jgi:predicted metal-binding protein
MKKIHIDKLVRQALSMGASDAKVISSCDIVVEETLARYCFEPRCDSYGLAPSCPPHVSGPSDFRALQKTHSNAIVVRIVVPSGVLFSEERRAVSRSLHELVARIEQKAVRLGYRDSKAFAGGSCKYIFCYEHADCCVVAGNRLCRHPQYARPSMSGFGINVSKLMSTCGWPPDIQVREWETDPDSMSWLAGLVMIG